MQFHPGSLCSYVMLSLLWMFYPAQRLLEWVA